MKRRDVGTAIDHRLKPHLVRRAIDTWRALIRSMPSRPPPQSPKSPKRQSIPAHAAAAACASSRLSCRGNSQSTARRHFRRRSASTPHDDNLTALAEKPFARLVAPYPAALQLAPMRPSPRNTRTGLHRRTSPPIRASVAPDVHRHPHRSTDPRG